MKRFLTLAMLLVCCLFTTVAFAANDSNKQQSVTDKGITFTIKNINRDGNRLIVDYFVESKNDFPIKSMGIISNPNLFINNKKINTTGTHGYEKVEKGKYTGVSEFELPDNLPNHFSLKFNTSAILEQKGQWTIQSQVN